MEIKFNLNWDVKVKLTDLGYQLWVEQNNRYIRNFTDQDLDTVEGLKLKEDKDGYVKLHLWEFMNVFGDKTYMGGPQLFEMNVILTTE